MGQNEDQDRATLLEILKEKSVFHGDFTLASGAKSDYYIDCRLTTLDARGAAYVGRVVDAMIRQFAEENGHAPSAAGGLTLGADPIALAAALASYQRGIDPPLGAFVVRKEPKGHGKGKRIEGGFATGDTVVAIDDVITSGGSTLKAIEAIENEGGTVAFVAVLVDRQAGGRENIEGRGYPVVSAFLQEELLGR